MTHRASQSSARHNNEPAGPCPLAQNLSAGQKEAPPHVVRSGASDMSEDDSGANGQGPAEPC